MVAAECPPAPRDEVEAYRLGRELAASRDPEALGSASLGWPLLRGYFDGAGSIGSPGRGGAALPWCLLPSDSPAFLDAVESFTSIPGERAEGSLTWRGPSALDLLGRLYDGASICAAEKRDAYLAWCTWVPGLTAPASSAEDARLRWSRVLPEARPPSKAHASDSGFDLTLVREGEAKGAVRLYRTGVSVQPPHGWYFDVVPRSSLIKTGYLLANSVGVIDRTYVGEILVPLLKVDPAAADLDLPARVVQLIPRPIVHFAVEEVDALDATRRSTGGFGSTG